MYLETFKNAFFINLFCKDKIFFFISMHLNKKFINFAP